MTREQKENHKAFNQLQISDSSKDYDQRSRSITFSKKRRGTEGGYGHENSRSYSGQRKRSDHPTSWSPWRWQDGHGRSCCSKVEQASFPDHMWRFRSECREGRGFASWYISLRGIFRFVHLWDCVLLFDEADVFITQRGKRDLARNSLVSGRSSKTKLSCGRINLGNSADLIAYNSFPPYVGIL